MENQIEIENNWCAWWQIGKMFLICNIYQGFLSILFSLSRYLNLTEVCVCVCRENDVWFLLKQMACTPFSCRHIWSEREWMDRTYKTCLGFLVPFPVLHSKLATSTPLDNKNVSILIHFKCVELNITVWYEYSWSERALNSLHSKLLALSSNSLKSDFNMKANINGIAMENWIEKAFSSASTLELSSRQSLLC